MAKILKNPKPKIKLMDLNKALDIAYGRRDTEMWTEVEVEAVRRILTFYLFYLRPSRHHREEGDSGVLSRAKPEPTRRVQEADDHA